MYLSLDGKPSGHISMTPFQQRFFRQPLTFFIRIKFHSWSRSHSCLVSLVCRLFQLSVYMGAIFLINIKEICTHDELKKTIIIIMLSHTYLGNSCSSINRGYQRISEAVLTYVVLALDSLFQVMNLI